MRASTERTLMTLLTLGILGVGAWWVWRNVLPAVARSLKTTPPTPAVTPSPIPLPDWMSGVQSFLESASLAFRNNFSDVGTKAITDQGMEGVTPSSTRLGVSLDEYLAAAKILAGHKIPGYEPFVSPFGIEHTADLSRAYPGGLIK